MAVRLKNGDTVQVMTGKERGKRGKIIQVLPTMERVVIENLNLMTKNVRSRRERERGQRIQFASPVRWSNVQLVCPKCGKVTRLGAKIVGERKLRVCAKCHEVV